MISLEMYVEWAITVDALISHRDKLNHAMKLFLQEIKCVAQLKMQLS